MCVISGSAGGLQGIAWGYSAGLIVSWFISLVWLKRCDAMPVLQFLSSGLHVIFSGLVSGGLGWAFVGQLSPTTPTFIVLASGFLLVTSTYLPLVLLSRSTRKLLLEISRPVINRAIRWMT